MLFSRRYEPLGDTLIGIGYSSIRSASRFAVIQLSTDCVVSFGDVLDLQPHTVKPRHKRISTVCRRRTGMWSQSNAYFCSRSPGCTLSIEIRILMLKRRHHDEVNRLPA